VGHAVHQCLFTRCPTVPLEACVGIRHIKELWHCLHSGMPELTPIPPRPQVLPRRSRLWPPALNGLPTQPSLEVRSVAAIPQNHDSTSPCAGTTNTFCQIGCARNGLGSPSSSPALFSPDCCCCPAGGATAGVGALTQHSRFSLALLPLQFRLGRPHGLAGACPDCSCYNSFRTTSCDSVLLLLLLLLPPHVMLAFLLLVELLVISFLVPLPPKASSHRSTSSAASCCWCCWCCCLCCRWCCWCCCNGTL
jgi:hypothetical protein